MAEIGILESDIAILRWAVGMADEAIRARQSGDDPEDTPAVIAMHREALAHAEAALGRIAAALAQASTPTGAGVPEGFVLVPEHALKWLNGEGPDDSGHWFGDGPQGRGAFSWRSKFRKMCEAAVPPQPCPASGAQAGLVERLTERCQCGSCNDFPHASDCPVHNEPAMPNGPCNCGATFRDALKRIAEASPEPDDKAWREGPWDDPASYRVYEDNGVIREVSTKDGHADDMEAFGYQRGIHAAAIVARAALTPSPPRADGDGARDVVAAIISASQIEQEIDLSYDGIQQPHYDLADAILAALKPTAPTGPEQALAQRRRR